jgi:hypothetical protein
MLATGFCAAFARLASALLCRTAFAESVSLWARDTPAGAMIRAPHIAAASARCTFMTLGVNRRLESTLVAHASELDERLTQPK